MPSSSEISGTQPSAAMRLEFMSLRGQWRMNGGRKSAKRSLSTIDALLAATAKVNGMTLAMRNISDVVNLGVHVLNPFDRRT